MLSQRSVSPVPYNITRWPSKAYSKRSITRVQCGIVTEILSGSLSLLFCCPFLRICCCRRRPKYMDKSRGRYPLCYLFYTPVFIQLWPPPRMYSHLPLYIEPLSLTFPQGFVAWPPLSETRQHEEGQELGERTEILKTWPTAPASLLSAFR